MPKSTGNSRGNAVFFVVFFFTFGHHEMQALHLPGCQINQSSNSGSGKIWRPPIWNIGEMYGVMMVNDG